MQGKVIVFATFLCVVHTGFSQSPQLISEDGWEFENNKFEIDIFRKTIDGYNIDAFKAVGVIDADITTVYNMIMDIEQYNLWYPQCESGEVLDQVTDMEQLRRIVFKLPWPFDRRDAVNKLVAKRIGETIWIDILDASDAIPKQRKTVRVPDSQGYWLLTPLDGKTQLTYSAIGEAPGIPAWIVNIFLFDSPMAAINNLRELVDKPEFQHVPDWLAE